MSRAEAWVDGSYNPLTAEYGWGGFIRFDDGRKDLYFSGHEFHDIYSQMRNVAGEVQGAMACIKLAKKHKVTDLLIHYDYMGIEMWANNMWIANKSLTRDYQNLIAKMRSSGMNIKFDKVRGHSGENGNELADSMARDAVGL